MIEKLRNVAIVAHVDHGKTTLVDKLLEQSGTLDRRDQGSERIMDSNDQEKERGITILAKNTAVSWNGYHINIVDTPGHADFGGEVERVLSMVDCVLLLVDAVDGPMPQTRFVTQKAFQQGLSPIVVINKIDRPGARPDWVMDQVFDLFDSLGATDEQLDFPVMYTSAINGIAGPSPDNMSENMDPLFEALVEHVKAPDVDLEGPLQMQISALDYSSYVGVIGVGRIKRGSMKVGQQIRVVGADGKQRAAKLQNVMSYMGLDRIDVPTAKAGDIVCVTGIDGLNISDTICHPDHVEALPALSIDEPTVSMTFQVNDSPFAGLDGKFVTSRNIRDRLDRELIHNVALRVEQGDTPDRFVVSGRGELHLSVLIESMRREGFEVGVGRPQVIEKEVDGVMMEPYEAVLIDCEDQHQGSLMEEMGRRKADMTNMEPDGKGRTRLEFIIPSRGLIGFRGQFLTLTSGSGVMTSVFDHYGEVKQGALAERQNGVLVSMVKGKILAFALFNLQTRGRLMVEPNIDVYEGMLIGVHSRGNDLAVNPTKGKQLTNIRAAGTDENIVLSPPIRFSLEQALEFIEDDELVEVTPNFIRLRKRLLTENARKRAPK
ncbi:translational GTPase TypA [Oceanospirillaceae bacterium]|jgi:GTP-binding protein|nr:translational GTPase TypA [Oceanospirillaceae bacterium]MBT4999042.1 translational GTPase TypA [Oceanospirillaceae bacterium]MBT6100885.1 translational GTPase TypA [Oceanospirillaceae bacterium]MBT7675063.1 translational GTPase TypA [Oceanospirillaceae bacterium]MDB9904552.1 translational GTPase TypA [Oceanospirillaceae bacterium]